MEDAPQDQPAQTNYTKHETELNTELSGQDAEQLAQLAQQLTTPHGVEQSPDPVVPELIEPPKELDFTNQVETNTTVADQVQTDQVQSEQVQTDQVPPDQQLVDAHIPPKEDDDDDVADQLRIPPSAIVATKLLIGSWLLKGAKPVVPGSSSPDPSEKSLFNIEVRFLYGRRRVKYEINQPGARLMIDYDFSAISGLAFKLDTKIMVVELTEPPTFSAREEGKWVKVLDFTQGNASYYRRHYIEFHVQNFATHVERLLEFDPRLKQLAEFGLSEISTDPSFAAAATSQTLICDWDRENIALLHCVECGSQSYCAECDEVLHRPPDKRIHKRISTHQMGQASITASPNAGVPTYNHAVAAAAQHTTYAPSPSPTPSPGSGRKKDKDNKRKKRERCRCGTGATRGTLGDPCTGNRCPCYSEGRGCSSCGCKNCRNPYNDKEDKIAHEAEAEVVAPVAAT